MCRFSELLLFSSDRVTLSLPFCSDHLEKEVRRIVRKSNLPVRIVYKQAPNLKQASEIGASTNQLHSPRQIHRGKATIKTTTWPTPRGLHFVSCWAEWTSLWPEVCHIFACMYDLLQGVCWRNAATGPGENARALCGHKKQEKRYAMGRACVMLSRGYGLDQR